MELDRRSETRELIRLPVAFEDGTTGLTQDVSPSGLSVEFNGIPEKDSAIAFWVTLFDNGRPLRLRARGQIVWVEPRGRHYGIGVRIVRSTLETTEPENGPITIH